jgi:hypothetical protein
MVGPQYDLRQQDVDDLVDYGIVYRDSAEALRPFSAAFGDYLKPIQTTVDIWPLWRDAECSLRDALERRLKDRYEGTPWSEKLKKERPKLREMIEGWEQNREKEKATCGSPASENLLACCYPLELYQIMCVDWETLGRPLLGQDKQSWSGKFSLLAKIRNPLAHNRAKAISEGERNQAQGICLEIVERIGNWRVGAPGAD